ncbi:MAG: acyl transferase [Niabella sp.]
METAQSFIHTIFSGQPFDFEEVALRLFAFQYEHNEIYRKYVQAIGVQPENVKNVNNIPFLPIRFFKTHDVTCGHFESQVVFESSGTTETINSRHLIKDTSIYETSFLQGFQRFFGNPEDWCIIGLLPSYLERNNSSLVYMVNRLIADSSHAQSGFYLHDFKALSHALQTLESQGQKTLLIGVTFALLDFAAMFPQPLQHTLIMETGGMKGRRKEMVREEVQDILKKAFQVNKIASEYGMTELLSQAYAYVDGLFQTPPWMRVLLRDEDDPLTLKIPGMQTTRGVINIVDLANIYSCAFIATDDLGAIYPDGRFTITGRRDYSDLRGCSLLAL